MTAQIELLATSAAGDEALVQELARLINDAYAIGEAGLWVQGAARTTPAEVAAAIRGGGLVWATMEGRVVGCACVRPIGASTADLGFVSVAPEQWGGGVGGELVRSAENLMRSLGTRTSQLELLIPRGWVHPQKDRLRAWYARLGYRVVRTAPFDEVAPQLTAQLATECEFLVFRKDLAPSVSTGSERAR